MSRLKEVYNYLKFSKSIDNQEDLANKLGYNRVSVSKAMNENNQYATDDFLSKLVSVFPTINIDWLKTGEGEMLRSDKPLDQLVKESNEIQKLQAEIELLKQTIEDKKKIIELYEKMTKK